MTHAVIGAVTPPLAAEPGLRIECLTSLRAVSAIEREWGALFARDGEALPFATFEWTTSWWTHLRRDNKWVHDSLHVFVVRDDTAAVVAIAPMMLTVRRVLGMPLLRTLQPLGTDPNITELRGLLVSRERERAAVAALADYVAEHIAYDEVRWFGLRAAETAEAVRPENGSARSLGTVEAYLLALPPSWDDFKRTLPRNIRESLRKCYNSLARDGHTWSIRIAEAPSDMEGSVGRLVELHARRASRTDTIRHRNCFDRPQARRFLTEVVERLARAGKVKLFELVIGDEVVAARIAFVFGDRMYLYYSGYDPAWGRYSVMTTVVAEALKVAAASGITSVNLSTGADESKLRWRPRPVPYAAMAVAGCSTRARLAASLPFDRAAAALRQIRETLSR